MQETSCEIYNINTDDNKCWKQLRYGSQKQSICHTSWYSGIQYCVWWGKSRLCNCNYFHCVFHYWQPCQMIIMAKNKMVKLHALYIYIYTHLKNECSFFNRNLCRKNQISRIPSHSSVISHHHHLPLAMIYHTQHNRLLGCRQLGTATPRSDWTSSKAKRSFPS